MFVKRRSPIRTDKIYEENVVPTIDRTVQKLYKWMAISTAIQSENYPICRQHDKKWAAKTTTKYLKHGKRIVREWVSDLTTIKHYIHNALLNITRIHGTKTHKRVLSIVSVQ